MEEKLLQKENEFMDLKKNMKLKVQLHRDHLPIGTFFFVNQRKNMLEEYKENVISLRVFIFKLVNEILN